MRERLRVAVQKKGRLYDNSMELFNKIGIKVEFSSKSNLLCHSINAPIDFLFVRDDDIPTLVNGNVCDFGIVGENVLEEYLLSIKNTTKKNDIIKTKKLGFGYCRLSIAVPNDASDDISTLKNTRIATSYPHLVQKFSDENNLNLDPLSISGSVEIAPNLQMSSSICDLVSTGRTLEENNLKEIHTIMKSQAILIRSNESFGAELEEYYQLLLRRIEGVKHAQERKYIMFHIDKDSIDTIAHILPGHEGQTIMPLYGDTKVAIHLVTKEGVFWGTLEKLKAAGASSILVLPIEKMLE
ncbi:ATP phosphoribosyltransferase [Francisella philomiragia]|uniref:ATP phosphoribosyltransferase n=1 Tax=Francisella philomiragia TaxID=28110 RepID=UPI001B8B79E0|nr:ATP phosphoribosyltransferase [Francisella philomiragia]QUE30687.1 ATP phosphoribosyltransferase [Francisella philomiragia]